MSLLETVRAGIETAFAVGNEFVSVGTYYHRSGQGNYDADTDTMNPAATTISNVRFLKTSVDNTEREASPVAITDLKWLVPAVDLPVGFKPGENDQCEPGDGLRYNIVASRPLPGDALFIFFGRKA